ncbi:acyltransferase [Mucilaginibacter sp.]|uniref:acyltransferase n=1 Tax=Mucilaginibacter sp. TaxID=1882438 RepID=UPI0025FCCEB0|nr:acyltransferase [Mucilaginibacter sp.]
MRQALKDMIGKIITKLKRVYEGYKLKVIYNNPNISIGGSLIIEEYFSASIPAGNFALKLGTGVHFKKYCAILLAPKAELTIGANVFFNNYCSINCLEKISIGENTQFGEGVKMYDHNHTYTYANDVLDVDRHNFKTAPITIGKNCWIGSNVTILKGVTIGDNVIIGANNLVYKSVPPNTVLKFKADYIIQNHTG